MAARKTSLMVFLGTKASSGLVATYEEKERTEEKVARVMWQEFGDR